MVLISHLELNLFLHPSCCLAPMSLKTTIKFVLSLFYMTKPSWCPCSLSSSQNSFEFTILESRESELYRASHTIEHTGILFMLCARALTFLILESHVYSFIITLCQHILFYTNFLCIILYVILPYVDLFYMLS